MVKLPDLRMEELAPVRFTADRDWIEHVPFAITLWKWLKPKIFVELGVRRGVSFSAFCKAATGFMGNEVHGIDHWNGDSGTSYDENIYLELQAFLKKCCYDFAHLHRATFDEAAEHFNDIDLLHIDGDHEYENVKHDFDTWLPLMSDRGIVLLHDTQQPNWGVGRVFQETSAKYPSFEFFHNGGLGVLAVGDIPRGPLWDLFTANGEERQRIQQLFALLGQFAGRE